MARPQAARAAPAVTVTMAPLFVDLDTAAACVALAGSTVQRLVRLGQFPKPVLLSPGRVGWRTTDLQDWAAARPDSDLLPPKNAGRRRAKDEDAAPGNTEQTTHQPA